MISLHIIKSLNLRGLFLRIPTAETVTCVSVVNMKKHPCWKQREKYSSRNAFGLKKRRMLGRASKMNVEKKQTDFTHIHLHHLTTVVTRAPYLDFQRAYIPPTTLSA